MVMTLHEFWQRTFQFTTSQGGRHNNLLLLPCSIIFQFTTSQGGRRAEIPDNALAIPLSIHDLTRRSTISRCNNIRFCFDLSIHDLTRRSTRMYLILVLFGFPFNSRPHKEVDCESEEVAQKMTAFNSRPHKEVDDRLHG